ncbi:MAG TPA: ubiquinol-cytochrome c reductase iron-sulfur subunit N-terminal domain-containing protein, partial [Methylophilaceae bacterium]|nr:ubiquinol-cytochrome c reductase iron-sulfur subunit N-terminal domain-containing protein [Methylophilaceae bacterium]
MAKRQVDQDKRRFLIAATTAVGGAGVIAVAVPFVKSMLPSDRAKAAGA